MTQEEIQTFLAVVEAGSLSKAADALYITCPALTHRIKLLEKKLGYQLIVRKPGIRRVELTPKGELFVPIAEQWNALAEKAYHLRTAPLSEGFSISAIESISSLVIAPVCRRLMSGHPNLRLSVKIQHSPNTYADVMNHSVDLGLINNTQHIKELDCQPAFQEKMLFVCRKDGDYPEYVDPASLLAKDSILVPWYTDFEVWYQYWFHYKEACGLFLQNSYLLKDCFISKKTWSIVPASVGNWLSGFSGFQIREILYGPVPRINYFLSHRRNTSVYIREVQDILREELSGQQGIQLLF